LFLLGLLLGGDFMISDVLSDAVCEVRRYQQELPGAYESSSGEIRVVLEVMDALRRLFDAPPDPALRPAREALGAAVRQLDLSAVRAAVRRLAR
jgi:hypothetical protein